MQPIVAHLPRILIQSLPFAVHALAALTLGCDPSREGSPMEAASADAAGAPTRSASPTTTGSTSTSGSMTREQAIAMATACAKKNHGGVGQWKSPLRFEDGTASPASDVSGAWSVVFLELEPKGKPQGLTLMIAADGGCTEAMIE